MIKFACICPHPPIILPEVGSNADRELATDTINALQSLGDKFQKIAPEIAVISSPHSDWGFKVPLHFLAKNDVLKIEPFLTQDDSPEDHYLIGKDFYFSELKRIKNKVALIASGDLSHRLKVEGPYGFHPDGPKFDKMLINCLINKDTPSIIKLSDTYPEAGECGLRSICFILGILVAAHINWRAEIISYQAPFGVGYLAASLIS